jgi:hypothetical protein
VVFAVESKSEVKDVNKVVRLHSYGHAWSERSLSLAWSCTAVVIRCNSCENSLRATGDAIALVFFSCSDCSSCGKLLIRDWLCVAACLPPTGHYKSAERVWLSPMARGGSLKHGERPLSEFLHLRAVCEECETREGS